MLLSSHLLNEVEQIADDMFLIDRGVIVAGGEKQSLLKSTHSGTLVTATDNAALAQALRDAGVSVAERGDGLSVDAEPLHVGTVAAQSRIVLTDLRPDGGGLEHLFLSLTSEGQRDALPPEPTTVPSEGAHA